MTTGTVTHTQANGNDTAYAQVLGLTRLQVVANQGEATTGGTQYAGISVVTLGPDMEIGIPVPAAIPGSASALVIILRLDTSGNGYTFEADSGTWFLNRVDAGTPTQLQTSTYTNGAHTYSAKLVGTTFQAFIDGVQVGTNQSAPLYTTNTKYGILALRNTGTLVWDNETYNDAFVQTIVAQVATMPLVAVAGTKTQGAVTVTAQVATLVLTAVPVVASVGARTITAQVATLTLTGVQGTITVGAITVTATPGVLVLTAVPVTLSAGTFPQTVNAQPATLVLTGVATSTTVGSLTRTAQVATITLTGVQGTLAAGGVTVVAQPATLVLTAVAIIPFAGTVVAIPGPVIYGQDPGPIRGRDPAGPATVDPGPIAGRDPAPIYGHDTRVLQGA